MLQSEPKTSLTPEDMYEVKAVLNVPCRREKSFTQFPDIIRNPSIGTTQKAEGGDQKP